MLRTPRRYLMMVALTLTFAGGHWPALAEPPALAIKGYDPVAYFTVGNPVRGRSDIEYEWDEHRYRFSDAKHRDLFRADPVRYAPQFSNFCAMALIRGKIVEADPENWLISDGKLYIFGLPEGRDLFKRDLTENIGKANEHRTLIEKR